MVHYLLKKMLHRICKQTFKISLPLNSTLTVCKYSRYRYAKCYPNDLPYFSFTLLWLHRLLEAQVGQKSLTWIRMIMICYIVPWWPSWLSDQIAFSNSESDVVWRVSRLSPWPSSWIPKLNDSAILNLHFTPMSPIKFRLNLTYWMGGDVIWRISRWRPTWTLEQKDFSNSEFPYHSNASHHV